MGVNSHGGSSVQSSSSSGSSSNYQGELIGQSDFILWLYNLNLAVQPTQTLARSQRNTAKHTQILKTV